ncbi:MAG: YdeI/OmpD-associated family protein [Alphaproteobacteria bacterium]|nr:YdeI/OmpD-associated family protein [Alphaproteobacteria bacterium]
MSEHARVEISSRAELRAWLSKHHGQPQSIWLVTRKKPDPRNVPYNDIVEEALCFGWVDSLPRALDEKRSMLRLSPRKPGSAWSKLNKQRVATLIASGLMQPAGLAVVEAAKASGTWDRLNEVEELHVPDDLAATLKKNKMAKGYFDLFPRSVKRAILEWILSAKKQETRASRIAETVSKAEKNIRANQWRQ